MAAATLTATEVAALAGIDESRVRKDVEHGIFRRPSFTVADLVYFGLLNLLGLKLGVDDRRKFHDVINAAMEQPRRPSRAEISPVLEVRLDPIAKEIEGKLTRFDAWKKKRVVIDDAILGGEPAFAKTRLAVRHIGGLLLKGHDAEVHEDYPYLTNDDIEFAVVYTKAYPKQGRPRERQTSAR
jgi:uncharacterized protein (DUF433 family)